MATSVSYHIGGYQAAAPQQNRAEFLDGPNGTYTAWDTNGVVTESRPLTAAEAAPLAAEDAALVLSTNETTIQQKAQIALPANMTYLGIASPTNAQVAAQVKALTQQNNAIIRLALGLLDATN